MRNFIIITFLILLKVNSFGQDKIITGRVYDEKGQPIFGVAVCQDKSNNCHYTDFHGVFHLLLDSAIGNAMTFSYVGFRTVVVSNIDTIIAPINIKMIEDTLFAYIHLSHPETAHKFGFTSFLQVDFIFNDFSEFEPSLSAYNVDLMNKSSGILSFELAGTYKKYYAGVNFGFSFDVDYHHDSLDIEFNSTQYGLHFGYNLINMKRFLVTPKVALKWNRYRLINNDKESKIPIEQYVTNRDLDIRFNQLTGFVGLNLSYKMYKYNLLFTDYWTVGIYGGYAFKLHDKPWIYSKKNRLTSDSKIDVENYNIGIYFSFNFD